MYEQALSEMRNSLKNTDLIIVIDTQGTVMYYNDFNDIYNEAGNQDNIGKSIFQLYPWLTKENSTIFKVIESGEPLVNQFQAIKTTDNKPVSAINSVFPLISGNKLLGAIEISSNIDGSKQPNKNKRNYAIFNAKYDFDNIITESTSMKELILRMKNMAKSNSSVLIYGETGTGKEIAAHAIHNASRRWDKPFVTQNCAAIPSTIIESILFGSVKGSFTGAEDKAGLFETANGGTIYLDEINSMPLEMQSKLLRTLEDRKIRRVGDNKDLDVDIRIIASTNEKPQDLLSQNKFRPDLFYRLSVVTVELPPLRERPEDIDPLCQYFIQYYNNLFHKQVQGITPELKSLLTRYQWPGNVRELKNCIESAYNFADQDWLDIPHMPPYILQALRDNGQTTLHDEKGLSHLLEEYEAALIGRALHANKYNIIKTAKELKLPRQTLYYKLKKYGLMKGEI
ncbi:AAA domain-containing protein [Aminipila butyrica]|uniref:AAA domain-containing protein n=1 Tax=Aminipila butyrica TaxID=433296 RepID=A0A858C1G9_9FIRM|nr:sigma 54-interacting transcriptional regulator [Aminipila butyrica]QIB70376.1 AAA domain-containing protein [Aminipila butyrica]